MGEEAICWPKWLALQTQCYMDDLVNSSVGWCCCRHQAIAGSPSMCPARCGRSSLAASFLPGLLTNPLTLTQCTPIRAHH